MAIRTTERDVKRVFSTTLTETEISPYVKTASLVVDTYLAGEGMSATLLREIELYLAAHFAAFVRDRPAIEEVIDEAEIRYPANSLGKNLDATPYGQIAKSLDTSGKLNSIGQSTTAVLEALDLW